MKRILFAFMVLLAANAATAQTKPSWQEMKDFHGVMAKTYHPAEENDLKPLRDSSLVLVTRAKAWETSTVPAGYNGEVTKPILKKLVKQCEDINKAVAKNKTDAELKTMITEAHDTFHEIMEKCRKEDHH